MQQKRLVRILITVAVLLAFAIYRLNRIENGAVERQKQGSATGATRGADSRPVGFNRTLAKIVYSRHARCRMDCRKIDESEIMEMRDKGTVNYAKSEPDAKRDPRFALEGVTHDNQHVRVVFAQTDTSLVVVTCIDLDTDWACNCN